MGLRSGFEKPEMEVRLSSKQLTCYHLVKIEAVLMQLLPPIAACLCAFAFPLAAQVLEVIPNRVMADESAAIRVKGLQPNERITIRAELVDGAEIGRADVLTPVT